MWNSFQNASDCSGVLYLLVPSSSEFQCGSLAPVVVSFFVFCLPFTSLHSFLRLWKLGTKLGVHQEARGPLSPLTKPLLLAPNLSVYLVNGPRGVYVNSYLNTRLPTATHYRLLINSEARGEGIRMVSSCFFVHLNCSCNTSSSNAALKPVSVCIL